MSTHRIGIMNGGGDAPGLNAVIRAVVKHGVGDLHWQIVGIEDAFHGLLESPRRLQDLDPQRCKGLLHRGGTVLGTSNKADPFAWPDGDGGVKDRGAELRAAIEDEGLEGLICIGGDGTQAISLRLMEEHGVPIVGVPKTIDNDLAATDFTFGFWSAVEVATEALDRLHTTAEAHDRVMLLEVMGRTAGWIALYAGVAGGADVIVLPEIDYDVERICAKIQKRRERGRHFTIIVVAEGASPKTGEALPAALRHGRGHIVSGGAAQTLALQISERLNVESRVTVLGHLQRGGSPVPFDRVLATRFGVQAVELVRRGEWGRMVRLRDGVVDSVPLAEAVGRPRVVSLDHPLLREAIKVGIELGAPL